MFMNSFNFIETCYTNRNLEKKYFSNIYRSILANLSRKIDTTVIKWEIMLINWETFTYIRKIEKCKKL